MLLRILLITVSSSILNCSVLVSQNQNRSFHYHPDLAPKDSFYLAATVEDPKRKKLVSRVALGAYSLSALYLGTVWYASEDLGHFRFFNDWREWQQMDKVGHALGGYHASKWMIDLYKWSGMPKRKAIIRGGLYGFIAMNTIEVFDGFAKKWGASLPDVGANFLGSSLAVMNQALWNENRLQLKFSYWPSELARSGDFEDLFGSNALEWLVKDYNGQTLWLSCRVHSFLPEGKFKDKYPRWLNVAVGYGAEGLQGGYGEEDWSVINAREYRQFYLGLDVDLSNIRVRQGWLHTLLQVLSIIHIPAPALRVDKNGLAFRWFQ